MLHDLRHAFRALLKSPGFTMVAVLCLGLGIGANTAMFSLIEAVMLRSLPVTEPEELVQVMMGSPGATFTNPIWEQLQSRQDVFAGIFAYADERFDLADGGEARPVAGSWVTGGYFSTLGVSPVAGRLPGAGDDYRGCPAVAALSHSLWQREYGGDPGAVGRTLSLNGHPFQIIGVADPAFSGVDVGRSVQVFAPLCTMAIVEGGDSWRDRRSSWFLRIMGRRLDGLTTERVRARLAALSPAVFLETVPLDWDAQSQREYLARSLGAVEAETGFSPLRVEYHEALLILMSAVGLVLLIACANVANLLMARAATRRREFAIRLAIGAGRARLLRQLLTESLLLSLLGAATGLLLAAWASGVLIRVLATDESQVWLDLSLNVRVLAFTATIATVTGLVFGIVPAWKSTRVDPHAAMKASDRTIAEGRSRYGIGKALVSGQIALSLVLVVSAGLLLGTFRKLATLDPGFRADGVLLASLDLGKANFAAEQLPLVKDGILAELRSAPEVVAASASEITPIGGTWNGTISVDGSAGSAPSDEMVYFNAVSDGFFHTLRTPLLAGRDFDQSDRPDSPPVAVVNETLARKFFGGLDPLGRRMGIGGGNESGAPSIEIVGVVGDTKYESLHEEALPIAYFPLSQAGWNLPLLNLELRTDGAIESLIPRVQAVSAAISPRISIEHTTLFDRVASTLARERLLAALSAFFGGLALLLAVIGLYGTMTQSVARRRKEIGIRMALGAARARVLRMVLAEAGGLVAVGLVLGGIAALATTRLVEAFLYGISPTDPTILALAALALAGVALAAGAVPAWRAAKVDPMETLREE
jgi:predicted permease